MQGLCLEIGSPPLCNSHVPFTKGYKRGPGHREIQSSVRTCSDQVKIVFSCLRSCNVILKLSHCCWTRDIDFKSNNTDFPWSVFESVSFHGSLGWNLCMHVWIKKKGVPHAFIAHIPLETAFALAVQREETGNKQHEMYVANASPSRWGPNATYVPPGYTQREILALGV